MLVYANHFVLEPQGGADEIIRLVAKWVSGPPGKASRGRVDATRLAEGVRELTLKDTSTLSSRACYDSENGRFYPYLFSAQFSHGDQKVSGRQWITEVGLHQGAEGRPVECSVLLRTNEISTRVTASIQVSRPRLVELLVSGCQPKSGTPGLIVKKLTVGESARAFLSGIERGDQRAPVVILSANRDGVFPVEPERVRSILVGLADVVYIPSDQNTFALQDQVGRNYMAFGGALNILFPSRRRMGAHECEHVLLRADYLAELVEEGRTIESEVLAAITHRTNLPQSWRHISPEKVSQAVFRAQFQKAIERVKATSGADDPAIIEYIKLLEAADEELRGKDDEIARAREDYQAKADEVYGLEAQIAGLKHALEGRETGIDTSAGQWTADLRETLGAVLEGNPTLQQVVRVANALYGERLVFLESAFASAKESDRGGFQEGAKAFELLRKLATSYWQLLADGQGDQQAKTVFGANGYAPAEASTLTNDGKRRRTFIYGRRNLFMEKHLKFGNKDSKAETLRIHFEWLASERKIVIGHCGKHLDF